MEAGFLAPIGISAYARSLMSEEPFVPYRIVLIRGSELSPAEDFSTAVIAARQAQTMGQVVWQIRQGETVILEGDELAAAIADGCD